VGLGVSRLGVRGLGLEVTIWGLSLGLGGSLEKGWTLWAKSGGVDSWVILGGAGGFLGGCDG